MDLITSDNRIVIDVGSADNMKSLYLTVKERAVADYQSMRLALAFLKTGACKSKNALETARQLNLVRDRLATIPPSDAVTCGDSLGDFSSVVTSCANLYMTADGMDLPAELIRMLVYAGIVGVDIDVA
jgi:hypothetical protein